MERYYQVSGNFIQGAGVTQRHTLGGTLGTLAEVSAQWKMPVAFTWKLMSITVATNSVNGSSTVRARKNGANGNQVITIPSGTSGVFTDTTNTDSVAVNDAVNYEVAAGGSSGSLVGARNISAVLDFSADNEGIGFGTAVNLSSTNFQQAIGANYTHATDANVQIPFKAATTLSNLRVTVSSNTRNGAMTVGFRKNGSYTALKVTVPASTTGYFENNSDTASFVADDLVSWGSESIGGSSGVSNSQTYVCKMTSDNHRQAMGSTGTFTASYSSITGSAQASTPESQHEDEVRGSEALAFQNLFIRVNTNSRTAASTGSLRKNGADAISVTIPAGTTGSFEETTTTVTYASGDDFNFALLWNGSGSGSFGAGTRAIDQILPELGNRRRRVLIGAS